MADLLELNKLFFRCLVTVSFFAEWLDIQSRYQKRSVIWKRTLGFSLDGEWPGFNRFVPGRRTLPNGSA